MSEHQAKTSRFTICPNSWPRQDIGIACVPVPSRRLFLNVPGYRGSLLGFQDKYLEIANHFAVKHNTAAVLTSGFRQVFPIGIKKNLAIYIHEILQFVSRFSLSICETKEPEIVVCATSAGAGAIASVAYKYPSISKMVLLNPSSKDIGDKTVIEGISQFQGDLVTIVGDKDRFIGLPSASLLMRHASSARTKTDYRVLNTGHGLSGPEVVRGLKRILPHHLLSEEATRPLETLDILFVLEYCSN